MPKAVERPKVTRQSTKPKAKSKESIADRITSVQKVDSGGIKLVAYGRAKTGKTRFASTFPKPLLFLGGEDGTRSIRNVKEVDFIKLEQSSDIAELLDAGIHENYQSLILDTVVALQDMILWEILGLKELPAQMEWGTASQAHYGQCSLQMKTILRELLSLPNNVVIVAHDRNFNDDGDTDLLMPSVGPSLQPAVAGWLNKAAEYIAHTFIQSRMVEKKVKVPGGKVVTKKVRVPGEYDFCLRIGPHPVYTTGFRVPVGVELPEYITDPSFDKINKYIKGDV